MAIKERKEREKQEMRNLIIESATRMFLKQGYDKTSIRNIADDIEYSPATIYLYFKDKDEIFYVIHENAFDILDQHLRQHDGIADPVERLDAIGRTYIRFGLENPDYYDLMFIMRAPMEQIKNEEKWKAGECAFGYLLTTLSECLEQKKIRPADLHVTAIQVWSYVHGLVSLYVRERMCILMLPDDATREVLYSSFALFISNLKT
ncbi:TetR/AcrR family transcriptional regulator [Dyadobacter sp. CY261]|uniref:TetR/AcrR family transcriptional regulator n=1 Tax=Dyadobacter sp. CY261 TaxID=2907203 RepID=UPI001F2D1315|nr:TetR/AcrR family transcriptional regulator [Dyadobacter sp. CY261]MCF0069850.1 TetR/AcrR family transcriptional regulator [Dyadobacter sp. CY261]